jgi:hypothetical protein
VIWKYSMDKIKKVCGPPVAHPWSIEWRIKLLSLYCYQINKTINIIILIVLSVLIFMLNFKIYCVYFKIIYIFNIKYIYIYISSSYYHWLLNKLINHAILIFTNWMQPLWIASVVRMQKWWCSHHRWIK